MDLTSDLRNVTSYNKIYLCPSSPKDNCEWEGKSAEILEHFRNKHYNMLIESNIFKAYINQDNNENRIMMSQIGLFLVQTNTCRKTMKFTLLLRFLAYNDENFPNIKYSVEISTGKFGFVNENCYNAYHPVKTTVNGVEVDIRTIVMLTGGENIEFITIKINILEGHLNLINQSEIKVLDTNTIRNSEFDNTETSRPNSIISVDSFNINQVSSENTDNDDNLNSWEYRNSLNYLEKYGLQFTASLEISIKCTNCQSDMIPPIYMCPDGHSVCGSCKYIICGICEQNITELRNIDLEEYSKTLEYCCRYEAQGCLEKFKYNEIRKHEIHCDYCIYKCELCTYEGRFLDIKTHFRIAHPSTKIYDTMTGIHFPRGSNFVIMNSDGVFYCTSLVTDMYVEWKVVFCGPKERYFSCEVQITGKKHNQAIRRYFLKRIDNMFKYSVSFDELKSANVKEKNSFLSILCY